MDAWVVNGPLGALERKPMVRREPDQRVLRQAGVLQCVQDAGHPVVDGHDRSIESHELAASCLVVGQIIWRDLVFEFRLLSSRIGRTQFTKWAMDFPKAHMQVEGIATRAALLQPRRCSVTGDFGIPLRRRIKRADVVRQRIKRRERPLVQMPDPKQGGVVAMLAEDVGQEPLIFVELPTPVGKPVLTVGVGVATCYE